MKYRQKKSRKFIFVLKYLSYIQLLNNLKFVLYNLIKYKVNDI